MAKMINCKSCNRNKPHEAFGLCKTCYHKRWSKLNKKHRKNYIKKYKKSEKRKEGIKKYNHSEKHKKCKEKYRNSEHGKKKIIEYRKSERNKEIQKKYRQSKNGKKLTEIREKKYRKTEKYKERLTRWRNSEKGKKTRKNYIHSTKGRELLRFLCMKRRIKKKNAEGSHTLEEWLAIRNRSPLCPMCGKFIECENLTEDHIIPLSKGGTDYIENIQALCSKCNSKKGTRFPIFSANPPAKMGAS